MSFVNDLTLIPRKHMIRHSVSFLLILILSSGCGKDDSRQVPPAPPQNTAPQNPVTETNPDILLRDGHYELAENRLRLLFKVTPPEKQAKLHYQLASALHGQGKIPEALVEAKKASTLQPRNPEVFRLLALITFDSKDYQESVRLFRQAIQMAIDFQKATQKPVIGLHFWRYQLAQALIRLGKKEEANKELELYREHQEVIQSIDRLERTTAYRPKDATAWAEYAQALWRGQKLPEAMAACRTCLKLDPMNKLAHAVVVLCSLDRGLDAIPQSQHEALKRNLALHANQALADLDEPLGLLAAGRLALLLNDRERALKYFEKGQDLDPKNSLFAEWQDRAGGQNP